MSTGSKTASLDDLISANQNRLDELFVHQMSGGQAARRQAPAEAAPVAAASAAKGPRQDDNVVAELNRRFGPGWSSKTLDRRIDGDRALARVEVTLEGRSTIAEGASRIDGEDEAALDHALDRAVSRALRDGAEALSGTAPSKSSARTSAKPSAQTAGHAPAMADVVAVNRLDAALAGLRRTMTRALEREAVSPDLPGSHGGMPMIMDGRGRLLSGTGGGFLAHMLDSRNLHFAPGDALLLSDPFLTGGASGGLKDWLVVCPVFHGSGLIGFTSLRGRMTDVGGAAHGSIPADAGSIFNEGLRIPPTTVIEGGKVNGAALDLILANSRTPDRNRADLMAMVSACRAGGAGLPALAERFGEGTYHAAATALLDRGRAAFRTLITAAVPEEPQSFEDRIDDDGCGGGPFALRLTVWREGDHAYFDWTGTSAQATGPVNHCLHVGQAKADIGAALTHHLGQGLAETDGYYDLLHVTVPKGSVLNPEFPAPTGRGGATAERYLEILNAALNRHRPEALRAAGGGTPGFAFISGGRLFADHVTGGGAAHAGGDGADGHLRDGIAAEDMETDAPILIESLRPVHGSAGAGRSRGGAGVEKVYRVLETGHVSIHDDRQASHPFGVNGGRAGGRSQKWIERADGGREALPAKLEGLAVQPGDRIIFRTAGGGGYGDPHDRDPAQVQADVAAGIVTPDEAARDYGVMIDAATGQIDPGATADLRGGARRGHAHPDKSNPSLFDRGDQA
ncbi:MAG: hydantoinase B/oxoprolinase family protein [Pseudomonadota bacterium]